MHVAMNTSARAKPSRVGGELPVDEQLQPESADNAKVSSASVPPPASVGSAISMQSVPAKPSLHVHAQSAGFDQLLAAYSIVTMMIVATAFSGELSMHWTCFELMQALPSLV